MKKGERWPSFFIWTDSGNCYGVKCFYIVVRAAFISLGVISAKVAVDNMGVAKIVQKGYTERSVGSSEVQTPTLKEIEQKINQQS